MFGTRDTGYGRICWSSLVGVYQALREINSRNDLLPVTQLRFAYQDSKCDSTYALEATLHLTQAAFDGQGVQAIIGAGCSAASVSAAQAASALHVPVISATATTPALSDGEKYPNFFRTIPSDTPLTVAMVDVLQNLLQYSTVAVAHSTDEYDGAGGRRAFTDSAYSAGLTIAALVTFANDATEFSTQYRRLLQSRARVIVLFAPASDGARFMRSGLEAGVGGA
eukprot:4269686-Prymnesium_polylepis.1